jgi:lysophospholipase L1-like esterase
MRSFREFSFVFLFCLMLAASNAASPALPVLKFNFGWQTEPGWTLVSPTNVYYDTSGYGTEPGAAIYGTRFAASDQPFYFSARLPEGNYRITATFGGDTLSINTVKAELRRLMLENIRAAAGESTSRTFTVNVRIPDISDHSQVHLKSRERTSEMWDWDDKLTLEFNGIHPSVRSLVIEPARVPTIFLAGDSTVCDQPAEPWNSWGQMLPRFFKPEIAVANYAESGETIASSLREQRFEKIFSRMQTGDYLFVQFGHNDQKSKATNALTLYRADLDQVIERTRALGGTPVLVTSMERKAGVDRDTLAGYPNTVRAIARENHTAFIDLNAMSKLFYRALGADLNQAFQDGTHHNNYGSYELAKCVLVGIKRAKLPIADLILDDFGDFNPAHPDPVADFQMPASPIHSLAKPLGN